MLELFLMWKMPGSESRLIRMLIHAMKFVKKSKYLHGS